MAEASGSPCRRPDDTSTPELTDSPRRGASNISTSTSSFEAGVQHDPNLNRLAINMFTKTEQYLQGELDSVTGEYQLLTFRRRVPAVTEMNRRTHAKYEEMKAVGQETHSAIEQLNTKYTELEPYLRQLEDVDQSLAKLEAVAIQLDAYSKQLESRFRAVSGR
ncbi:biogenesis of lysosome-related organelles complex 1 subunit 2-like [Pollicipes pollicipes]|uniref:biogenesis of lysosome-related organelles complex 1 subunit 2-like n=1 Tax=Pollicipes pollicipes TaxID=41117 RepID=UPI001884F10E|nr:biogenesis of lysosome-related organelles complex 1 subunit 2-like [Pollicipes pollicipes]